LNGLLLDTHVLLWWLAGSDRLLKTAAERISDPGHAVFVSAASVWEIGIKISIGRLEAPGNLLEVLEKSEFQLLDITARHAMAASELPKVHHDPFDRMLIAQARVEDLLLMSSDQQLRGYDVRLEQA